MTTTIDDVDIELKLAEFRINGYVVFEDLFPHAAIDRIVAAFVPLLEKVRARETEISGVERGDIETGMGKQQMENRYTMTVPWTPPFTDPVIFEHPVILEFVDRYFGHGDCYIACHHSNNPYPGAGNQHWHRDSKVVHEIPQCLSTVPILGMKFPLVDTSEENGSIEVLPSTQYLVDADLEGRYDEVLSGGDFRHAIRLNLRKGSVWIQDPRVLHHGTPNTSDQPRPEIVICYCQPWYAIHVREPVAVSARDFTTLSERGKHLLRRGNPTDE